MNFFLRTYSPIFLFGLGFCIFCFLLSQMLIAPAMGWNDMRLAPSMYLLQGSLHYGQGAELSDMALYGPGMALVYLPAALGKSPESVIYLGTLISWIFGFLALLLPLRGMLKDCGALVGTGATWLCMSVCGYTLSCGSTFYALFQIHADAPAISALSLALCCIIARRDRFVGLRSAAAAILCVFAMSCKIIYFTGFIAVIGTLFIVGERRCMRWFMVYSLLFGLAAIMALEYFIGLSAVLDSILTLPAQHPWIVRTTMETVYDREMLTAPLWKIAAAGHLIVLMSFAWILPLLLLAAGLWKALEPIKLKLPCEAPMHRWVLGCGLMALLTAPMAIVGYSKVGGDQNTLGPLIHFTILTAAAVLLIVTKGRLSSAPAPLLSFIVTVVLVFRLLDLSLINGIRLDFTVYKRIQAAMTAHPGEIWFRTRPLAHHFFGDEKSLSGDVLWCYYLADRNIDERWLRSKLPAKFKYSVAYKFDPDASYPSFPWKLAVSSVTELGKDFNVLSTADKSTSK